MRDLEVDPVRAEATVEPPATYGGLAAIKRRRDPDSLLRVNQNIPPEPDPA